jgi:hypothetical protein
MLFVLAKKQSTLAPPRPQSNRDPNHSPINDLCKQLLEHHHDDAAEIAVVRQLRAAVHDYMREARERLTLLTRRGTEESH